MRAWFATLCCCAGTFAHEEPMLKLPSWARALQLKRRNGPVPDGSCDGVDLTPNTKVTCTAQDGDTCASIAYQFRLKTGIAVYIMRADGGLCAADDELASGEQLTLQTNALQGVIGNFPNEMKPPALTTISNAYNQLVVNGATDKAGGGNYTVTGAIGLLLPQLGPWKDAFPGTRQVLLQVNEAKKASQQTDEDWAKNAYASLVNIANANNCDGFMFGQYADQGSPMTDSNAMQLLLTKIKVSPWAFVGYVGGPSAPAMAKAASGLDSFGFTGSYQDGRFVNYPGFSFSHADSSYYVFTRSSNYVGANIGLEVWCYSPYGVTIDSIETEYYGQSCSSGRRLQQTAGFNSSLSVCASGGSACNGGKCCATDFVVGKWGIGSIC